jgi:hypothetical protein
MEFSEAKDKLKELAKGKHHAVEFMLAEYTSGKLETRCSLYIEGAGYKVGPTWEKAFAKLEPASGESAQ